MLIASGQHRHLALAPTFAAADVDHQLPIVAAVDLGTFEIAQLLPTNAGGAQKVQQFGPVLWLKVAIVRNWW
jgi:hypothetical protein